MNALSAKIEAVLFVSTKPMHTEQLATILQVPKTEIDEVIAKLSLEKNTAFSGIHIIHGDEGVMLVSNPAFSAVLAKVVKEDVETELTRPSLETLTIVAYRGPITKPEIEAIRGVNCALILRNLLTRGLVAEKEDAKKMQLTYTLTNDALRYLGIHTVNELPDYHALHEHQKIDQLLAAASSLSV